MKWILAIVTLALFQAAAAAERRPILRDPIALNIGVNCQWQSGCMAQQRRAMKSALSYVAKSKLPQWRIELCNRNAGRGGNRVDWIGFDHCIRNAALRPPPARRVKRPAKR